MINTSTNMGNAFQQGVSGLHNSQSNIVEAANNLVREGSVERAPAATDIVEPMVRMHQQQHVFNASAEVVKAADDAIGALIDVRS